MLTAHAQLHNNFTVQCKFIYGNINKPAVTIYGYDILVMSHMSLPRRSLIITKCLKVNMAYSIQMNVMLFVGHRASVVEVPAMPDTQTDYQLSIKTTVAIFSGLEKNAQ